MFGKCSNLHQLCIHVENILQRIASTKIRENYLFFWCSCFLQNWKKRKLSIAHSLLEKEKTSVTSPMKVTIGPETIVITNLCHYRHFHHHHIPLWVMEASKQWSFRLKKENIEQAWNKIRFIQETTILGCLNLISKIYWLRWTKMSLCSPPDISRKSSKYRPGLWDFFGVTRETLGNSESTAKDRAVSLFHVHFIPAWHHHLHLTICQPSSPQRCHHHQHYPHVIKPVF